MRRYTIIVSFETCCGEHERSLRSQSLPIHLIPARAHSAASDDALYQTSTHAYLCDLTSLSQAAGKLGKICHDTIQGIVLKVWR